MKHEQTKHFFNVTVETNEPVTREEAKEVLVHLLNRGRRKGSKPTVHAVGEKKDA